MKRNLIFKTIYYIFIVFFSVIALSLVISIFPITGNFKVFVVESGSMQPAISTGSVVIVKPVDNYKIGDIITFGGKRKGQAPITHRINEMKLVVGEPHYITKGDANNTTDSKEVLKKDIVGKVLFHIPYLGYAVAFAKKPIGFALIIIIPAGIIIFDESKAIWKEIWRIKKEKNNKDES